MPFNADAFYGPSYWSSWTSSQNTSALMIDTHNFYAFPPDTSLDQDEILEDVCSLSQILHSNTTSVPPTILGEWSLQSGANSTTYDQAWRTWLRLLFEAQIAAYTPTGPGQPTLGWIFWAWKTEHDINTWSYRRGIAQGYIPADAGNASQLVYPLLANGCVDSSYTYTAPATVSTYVPPNYAAAATATGAGSTSTAKSSATSVRRLGGMSWGLIAAIWAVAWCVYL